jgi:hypothetical protein
LPPFISFSISYPELDSAVRRAMRRISKVAQPACNRCVQATPDCALLFIVAQVAGAPDADRYANTMRPGIVRVTINAARIRGS